MGEYKMRVTDTKSFIQKASKFHGDLYSYEKTAYINTKTKVCITCPKHGDFYQLPCNHMKHGCDKCAHEKHGVSKRNTTEGFITQAQIIHDFKYSYDKTEYRRVIDKVIITCKEHGDFTQKPNSHLSGAGCPKCSGRGLSDQEWIARFEKVHGNKYDYSGFSYLGNKVKSQFICNIHGAFYQIPMDHIQGKNCPECFNELRSDLWNPNSAYGIRGYYGTENPSNLYVVQLGSDLLKIGLSKDVSSRITRLSRESGLEIQKLRIYPGKANELFEIEQDVLSGSNLPRYIPDLEFRGRRECFPIEIKEELLRVVDEKFN